MVERINLTDSWQTELERMSLHDTLSREVCVHYFLPILNLLIYRKIVL